MSESEHEIVSETTWHSNGAQGMKIGCRSCGQLLWQSGEAPFIVTESFVAGVAESHRQQSEGAEMDTGKQPAAEIRGGEKPADYLPAGDQPDTDPERDKLRRKLGEEIPSRQEPDSADEPLADYDPQHPHGYWKKGDY